jgi:3-hydroxyisobutyrate dehydrogenase-like beta-hydroxyacid dehydrogenase
VEPLGAASPLAIACVLDDAARHSVLDPVAGGLSGRALVNLTSGMPEQARSTAAWAADHGIDYLDTDPELASLYDATTASYAPGR